VGGQIVLPKPTRWVRYFLDFLCAIGCGFAAIRLAGSGHLVPLVSFFRVAGVVLLWIAAIYFWQHGMRLAFKLREEKAAQFEAENAPISLGLSRDQLGSGEKVDDNGL
jgi:hypothetical protein